MSEVFSDLSFQKIGLHERLADVLTRSDLRGGFGFSALTSVQKLVLPTELQGSSSTSDGASRGNVLIKSQTGSGKSLCYLLPIVNDLMTIVPAVKRESGTRALVISPTRELSNQISSTVEKLTQCCVNVVSGNISGGEKKKNEKVRLRKGLVVVIGTPGRLLDHLQTTESFNLQHLKWIVFDEVDRLLDLGFGETIKRILNYITGNEASKKIEVSTQARSRKNVTLTDKWSSKRAVELKKCSSLKELSHIMCSATMTSEVHKLAHSFMGGTGYTFYDNDKSSSLAIPALSNNSDPQSPKVSENVATEMKGDRICYDDTGDVDGVVQIGEEASAPLRLRQFYMSVPSKFRLVALASFLRTHMDQKVIVFFSTCDSVEFHSLLFREGAWPTKIDDYHNSTPYAGQNHVAARGRDEHNLGFYGSKQGGDGDDNDDIGGDGDAATEVSQYLNSMEGGAVSKLFDGTEIFSLHGKISQDVRRNVIKKFTRVKQGYLFCTDVVARGLDLPSIKWILQYDPPCEVNDYVHRCGRTARKGEEGDALLFLLPSEMRFVNKLHSLGHVPEQVSLQKLFLSAGKPLIEGRERKEDGAKGKNKYYDELFATTLQRSLDASIRSNAVLLAAAKQSYRSFLRSYTTYSTEMKQIFSIRGLHHNHVARSFGLKDMDISSYKHKDVISHIIKGKFAMKKTLHRNDSTNGKSNHSPKKRKKAGDDRPNNKRRAK